MREHGDMKFFQLFRVELRRGSCVATGDAPVYLHLLVKLGGVDVNQG